ncbi:MAG: ATP-binding cassette domain-containing protein [archaeon]|nr:ATP-binding cassette domain-containing protein [archaeon]
MDRPEFLSSSEEECNEDGSETKSLNGGTKTESLKEKQKMMYNLNDSENINISSLKKEKNVNYKSAGIFSRLTFNWASIALTLSRNNTLKTSDLSTLDKSQQTQTQFENVKNFWEKFKEKKMKYPFVYALFRANLSLIIINFIIELTLMGQEYLSLYLNNKVIYQFSVFDKEKDDGRKVFFTSMKFVIGLCISKLYRTFSINHSHFLQNIISERITNSSAALLYHKNLKCNTNANVNTKEEGEKLNLIEEDCERIGFIFGFGPKILIDPFKIGIGMFWLLSILGRSFFYGFIALSVTCILLFIIQSCILRNFKKLLQAKDAKLKEMVNDLQSIKQIKLNGMDNYFLERIYNKREEELKYLSRNLYLGIVRSLLSQNMPLFMRIISISVYIYKNKSIEVSDLFTIINLIDNIAMPILNIPNLLTGIFQNLIAISRIQDFLNCPEHDYTTHENKEELEKNGTRIKYENITFGITSRKKENLGGKGKKGNLNKEKEKEEEINTFEMEEKMLPIKEDNPLNKKDSSSSEINRKTSSVLNEKIPLLNNISLEIKEGEFIGILGKTGSGKTCLINSILNNYEIFSKNSDPIINGVISFEAQQPFIIHETVKNNILFDSEYNEERYKKVIKCCQLINDLKNFPNNQMDELMVSQNGSNLSGGQKARISLARCLYREADIYLLDDPISSIDSKISRKIMVHAFKNFLQGKVRILATNEISDITIFDKIIILDNKEIKFFGTPSDYQKTIEKNDSGNIKFEYKESTSNESIGKLLQEKENNSDEEEEKRKEEEEEKNNLKYNEKKISKYMSKYSTKSVPMRMYHKYIMLTGGYQMFLILIALIVCSQISRMKHQKFTASWSKTAKQIKNDKRTQEEILNDFWLSFKFYIIYNFGDIFFRITTEVFRTCAILNVIRRMFIQMIDRIIRAPVNTFHDICPNGHILSRINRDLDRINRIIMIINMFLNLLLAVFTSCYMCYEINPYSLVVSPMVIIAVFAITYHYLPAARGLQRLHRATAAPILSLFSEGVKGVETIRALKVEDKATKRIFKKFDNHFGIHLYIEGAERRNSLFVHALVHIFYCIGVSFLLFKIDELEAKGIGILLQQMNRIVLSLIHLMLSYKDLEVVLISLERCEAYANIPLEKEEGNIKINRHSLDAQLSSKDYFEDGKGIDWPQKGKIEFKDYSVKYRPKLSLVLENINLSINPGEKLGIVGRTGSGKSTIVLGLARIIEPYSGHILIDGVDISELSLKDLRRNLTIVSQDPFIIEGTIKENLDPLNKFNENKLLSVMDDFCLLKNISDKKKRINYKIIQDAKDLSVGEKQLICFARAALMNNSIVILDEATANMDSETEKIMKKNMEKYFKGKTMIIIAHHIQMVTECNRIAVIDNHSITECDTYQNLLADKTSKFFELYKENHMLLK